METTLKTAKDFREYFSKGEAQLNALIEEYLRAATKDDLERIVKELRKNMFTHPALNITYLFIAEIQVLDKIVLQFVDSEQNGVWFNIEQLILEDKLFLLDKIQEIL